MGPPHSASCWDMLSGVVTVEGTRWATLAAVLCFPCCSEHTCLHGHAPLNRQLCKKCGRGHHGSWLYDSLPAEQGCVKIITHACYVASLHRDLLNTMTPQTESLAA